MNKLTVILPAAGKGTRLNLPYPKEILRLNKEKALIDNSFELFSDLGRNEVEFVVVINEEKTEIVKYLGKYKNLYNISFTYQNPKEMEYTGAIKSAQHLFGERNLVLLPDTLLTLPKGTNLNSEINVNIDESGFTFLFKPEPDGAMLRTKGCLKLTGDLRVVDYEDKPLENLNRFDGYWCAFAFHKDVFDKSISFMEKSTLKMETSNLAIEETNLFNSRVISVEDYKDLGTWDEIGKFLSKNQDG